MPDDSSRRAAPMPVEKALFTLWLAFIVGVIVLFAVIGARHG